LDQLYELLGFYNEPQARMEVTAAGAAPKDLRVSPLQMALATAALSNNGVRPAVRIAVAVNTPQQGWVILPALDSPVEALPGPFARETAQTLAGDNPYWSYTSASEETPLTWQLAGTLPDWSGTPLALVVLLEEKNPALASQIGSELLDTALQP
jgi:membrane peptidoglycan carboxypeptidase